MKKVLLVLMLAALMPLFGASPSGSATSWPETYALPSDVNPALTSQVLLQGTAVTTSTGSGCDFTYSGVASSSFQGQEQDEVAFDPSTCQALYDVGPVQHSLSELGGVSALTSGQTTQLTTGTRVAFFLKTFYEDPARIDVSSLRDDLEWRWSGKMNLSDKWKRDAHWFTPSGWVSDGGSDSPSFGAGNAVISSTWKMENDVFCPEVFKDPEFVHTDYNGTKLDGQPTGVMRYSWHDYVSSTLGLCYHLLSHHHVEKFETPW
jgi:hypothetical protein